MMTSTIDEQLLQHIEEKFQYKRNLAKHRERELFGAFEQALTDEERVLLKFLYAYMPLHDLADYDGEFFLAHVRRTLQTRELVPWGSRIPDYMFMNFVLPYRVNNENIDGNREVIFHELYGRVKDKSMKDAILETNYWCHEKATYVGTDQRTVSPLTLMRTALGRCGEQSTLAVAALRSLGIPARQCYTPRWAHCDSNHAWVEAWADGEWYFLGACEPEGRLNEGWFKAPSRRAMLVNTRVSADYNGPEETCSNHPWYTEINLLGNYALHKTITIKVVNEKGKPTPAEVHFQMYNFAEFYSVSTLPTDENGVVKFTTGYGDLLIHVRNDQGYGYRKISVGEADVFEVAIESNQDHAGVLDWDMVPPPEIPDKSDDMMTEEERHSNDNRVQHGTATRAAFVDTFWNAEQAEALAQELGLPAERVWKILQTARGNSPEIALFLQEQTPRHGEWALKLLESLREKDLQDTMVPSLVDHLEGALPYRDRVMEESLFVPYVLCPRVHFEMIAPYRTFFQQEISDADKVVYTEKPQALADRLAQELNIVNDLDRYMGMAAPEGAFALKCADRLSRDICFVAMARSLGIPARLEPLNALPQYWQAGEWHDASFHTECQEAGAAPVEAAGGCIQFSRSDNEGEQEAAYYQNFTIARLENGVYRTLTFPFGEKDVYDKPIEVMSGEYRLTTGTRLSDGTVLVRLSCFTVPVGDVALVPIVFRKEEVHVPVLGTVTEEQWRVITEAAALEIPQQGLVLAWLDPEREPSKHIARELRELKSELDEWGGRIALMVEEQRNRGEFNMEGLPIRTSYDEDAEGACLQAIQPSITEWNGQEYPLVLIVDHQYRIRYQSQGYKLGIGADIVKTVKNM
ncbi:transglutaminase domain-containing protein [Paenibacillus sp. MER TA 81-3]|nr:transglutaminase domain-containing protein [Paenibacillus sp. MER TA 81-3]